MADTASPATVADDDGGLKRSITGRLLFFYVLGDVLGSGIYVLIGSVAGEVGGAFWAAFAVGVTVAGFTGLAYAELATKYPQAAGASLYVNKAFGKKPLTFLTTVTYLSATFAAAGSLAAGFSQYVAEVWDAPPALLVMIAFILLLALLNFIGITESVVANMLMTFVEIIGLVIVVVIAIIYIGQGKADFSALGDFSTGDNVIFAIVAGVALSFFAMTGFENVANVAEETVDPSKNFPIALIGGMATAGVIYVLVSMSAALTVPIDTLAESDAALLEVVKAGILPLSVTAMTLIFAIIAMIAITNTTLVQVVTQSRILYGMAREDVVPAAFGKIHSSRRSPYVALVFSAAVVIGLVVAGDVLGRIGLDVDIVSRLASVTVALLLAVYAGVIVSCFKLRGQDESDDTFRAPSVLLVLGLIGNIVLLGYVVVTDPSSLIWCAALVGLGGILYVVEKVFGSRNPDSADTGAVKGA
ncbi:APC family permease [Nocardioides sp. zg-1228]|uniref:APC family permease n=1 Tax=Nocardioides sp. zg-1228 TaxID=2763008 RepID=UPI001642B1DF|nr:APC family permease [Nocardioides sp. zg-1228]MBC2933702.1 APC family permease [Nocardioides sp. zg-1228]QSF58485.1 APC family permease [Nocardioides sp. zg-1228]